jgi:hypothetical protein
MSYNYGGGLLDSTAETTLLATLGVLQRQGDLGPYSVSTLRKAYVKGLLGKEYKSYNRLRGSFNGLLRLSIRSGLLKVSKDPRGRLRIGVSEDWAASMYPKEVSPSSKDLLSLLDRDFTGVRTKIIRKFTVLGSYKKGILAKREEEIKYPRLKKPEVSYHSRLPAIIPVKAYDFCSNSMFKDSGGVLSSFRHSKRTLSADPSGGLCYRDAGCLITFSRGGVPTHRLPRLYSRDKLVVPISLGLHKEDYEKNLTLSLYKRKWLSRPMYLLPIKKSYSEEKKKWIKEFNREQKKRIVPAKEELVKTLRFKTFSDFSSFSDFESLDPLFRSPVKGVHKIVVKRVEELPKLRRDLRERLSKGKRKTLYLVCDTTPPVLAGSPSRLTKGSVWVSNEILEDTNLKKVEDFKEGAT